MRQGSEVYFIHGDHLGSVSLTTDASGALVSQARYLPYGQDLGQPDESPTDFGFTGQRNDGFGLMDYKARYYSPYLNRFVSADTMVPDPTNPQNFNRYAYGLGNPLKFRDPSGHDVDCGIGESGCRQRVAIEKRYDELTKTIGARIEVRSGGHPGRTIPSEYKGITDFITSRASEFGILLDVAQTAVSAAGIAVQVAGTLGGPVGKLAGLFTDETETRFGDAALATNGFGDLIGGYTYVDWDNQEFVLGQNTTLALGQQVADNLIPGSSTADLAMNVATLGLDVSNYLGGTKPYLETRMSLSQRTLVIYGQPVQETRNNLRDFLNQGKAVKCPPAGCWSK